MRPGGHVALSSCRQAATEVPVRAMQDYEFRDSFSFGSAYTELYAQGTEMPNPADIAMSASCCLCHCTEV